MQPNSPALGLLAALILPAYSPARAAEQPAVHGPLSIEAIPFGATQDGQPVELYTLSNSQGLSVKVMTYGAILYSLETRTAPAVWPT